MMQLGRFDQLGSGVTNIYKFLPLFAKDAIPTFEETQHGFQLTLPLKKVNPEVTPDVTPDVMNMLRIIKGEMTRNEIMIILGLKDEKHFREHYMQTAINAHVVEMTIPDKPRSKNQKYRLTAKGQNLLKDSDDK